MQVLMAVQITVWYINSGDCLCRPKTTTSALTVMVRIRWGEVCVCRSVLGVVFSRKRSEAEKQKSRQVRKN